MSRRVQYPPGPRSRLPLGDLLAFKRDPLRFLSDFVRRHGDISHFTVFRSHIYLLNHPDLAKEVLTADLTKLTKSRGMRMSKRLFGDGLLTSEGAYHRRQRRMVQPAFHPDHVATYGGAISDSVARLQDRWTTGETVDVAGEMKSLTLTVIGRTLFGQDFEDHGGAITEALHEMAPLFTSLTTPLALVRHWPLALIAGRLPLPSHRRFRAGKRRLDDIIYGMIQRRRAAPAAQADVLSMLLAARDEQGRPMTDTAARDEVVTLLGAGHETIASALTWTWYLVEAHPGVESQLHDELDTVLRGSPPTVADLPRLPFTRMVLAEAMRLYPPAWLIGRRTVSDHQLGSYVVPGGSTVLVSPYVAHRDERFYPSPDEFDPQRWTPEAEGTRPKFAYLPFGGGQRMCIGEDFAWTEGVLLIASLAQRWRMRLVPGFVPTPEPLITLRPNRMPMSLSRRAAQRTPAPLRP